jgi:hypothetical protein
MKWRGNDLPSLRVHYDEEERRGMSKMRRTTTDQVTSVEFVIGDGASRVFSLKHDLNSADIRIRVTAKETGMPILCTIDYKSLDVVQLFFSEASLRYPPPIDSVIVNIVSLGA